MHAQLQRLQPIAIAVDKLIAVNACMLKPRAHSPQCAGSPAPPKTHIRPHMLSWCRRDGVLNWGGFAWWRVLQEWFGCTYVGAWAPCI